MLSYTYNRNIIAYNATLLIMNTVKVKYTCYNTNHSEIPR